MPFTPFHLGPGLLVKSFLRRNFSFIVFAWSQILIDIPVLIAIFRHAQTLHGFSHTFLGATLVALISAATGFYLPCCVHRIWPRIFRRIPSLPLAISFRIALSSACIGTYSHVILDGLMHWDLEPFAPFSHANPLLGLISTRMIHMLCFACALIGALIYRLDTPKP